ncbi:tRNA (adenosine(37)-N6)-dimethylallyltransferase MiaA [Aurantiacibacter poecillastricola]|uniref:tRNA (adenosine(37)-N6)-dimethylallyltransferase MiaA n=1 Tax=Aurantiacibacter poecillastricola TaxID=3064385 RepID=UPI00273D0125|nr:tRNA (adenosine(37)-N6)-dimethylallyltransferase MiaA [Aurantiacibacter sp. 219JJ12-13]MDP5261915.1 tRNA (adenosine(37)-N6)-dimethylallyltransferase MiaA [Aurantiacibacter sp. 219JJ12-13]
MSKSASPNAKPPKGRLALIAGPTASGKSDCAVELALALEKAGKQAVVINADSAQVYADLRILSARPTEDEMRGVPHRLFGVWDGAEACSAAEWADAAKREIENAHLAEMVPILVGGTGLYIRTLLDGIAPVPPIHEHVREAVRAMETADLYDAVQREDPEYARSLRPADRQRLARALEVVRSTGRSLLAWQRDEKAGGIGDSVQLAPLIILPEREWLYERCNQRFAWMMQHGAVHEVEKLLARELSADLPVMRAIGVPQIADYLRGATSREEAIAHGQQVTRQYAKRQYTWLRHQPPDHWPLKIPENISLPTDFEILFSD